MSADKVMRADLLDVIQMLVGVNAGEHRDYRGHRVGLKLSSAGGWARISVLGSGCTIEFDRRSEDITDTLRALRDLDYLIDVLDNVDEPNLKED